MAFASSSVLLICVLVLPATALKARVGVSPVSKVVQLLTEMQTKMIKDGEVEQANFEEYSRFCERTSIEKQNSIKDMGEQIVMLKASSEEATSEIEILTEKTLKLTEEISSAEEQVKKTSALRAKEHGDFLKSDGDLSATESMLNRAHKVLKANVDKAGEAPSEALLQVTDVLKKMVDASFVTIEDRGVISALIQQSDAQADGSDSLDLTLEPANEEVDAYKEKSGGIIDTLQSMKEKAAVARNELQKQEMKSASANDLLQLSLSQELGALRKMLDTDKKAKNKNAEQKATAEGELELVKKDKASEEKFVSDLQKDCMAKADNFAVAQKERAAEVNVLKEAKAILTKGAFVQTGSDVVASPSFLQVSAGTSMTAMLQQRQLAAAQFLNGLADSSNNWVLAQISSRLQADPFGKVKDMITEMVEKLLQEQAEEAEHKVWCDQEIGKTTKQLHTNQAKVDVTNVRIEEAGSASKKLGGAIKKLIEEMGQIDAGQVSATEMRNKENAEFKIEKEDLEMNQKAVQTALNVLRSYYEGGSFVQQQATDAASMESLMSVNGAQASGGASSIMGLLEVAESDFSKGLAELTADEDVAVQEYKELTIDNKVARAEKLSDQKGKEQEKQRLDSLVAQTKLDLKDSQEELDAIMEYMDKLKGSCETKPPAFEERQARRKQELEGLQSALAILDGKAIALLESVSPAALLRGGV